MSAFLFRRSGAVFLLSAFLCFFVLNGNCHAASTDQNDSFTITKIVPDEKGKQVQIHFSGSCSRDELKSGLAFRPFASIDWHRSSAGNNNVATITARFKKGETYSISLPAKFSCKGKSYKPSLTSFLVSHTPPSVEFLEGKTLIERNSRQMIHVSLTNTHELMLRGITIPPIMAPLLAVSLANDPSVDDARIAKMKQEFEALSRQLKPHGISPGFFDGFTEDRVGFVPSAARDKASRFSIPLTFRSDKEKGAIELINFSAKDTGGRTGTAARLFRITDIGITWKLSEEGFLLWATSLKTGKPMPNVHMVAWLADGSLFTIGTTDAQGLLIRKFLDRSSRIPLRDSPITMINPKPTDIAFIVAATSDDATYLKLDATTALQPAGVTAQDPRTKHPALLKGHIFTERGIYRPGEKVFFKGTLREYRDKGIHVPQLKNVHFSIVNAKQETIYNREHPLSDFGTASGSIALENYFPLGTYTVTMRAEHCSPVTASFEVQEFKAPRHFTEVGFKRFSEKSYEYANVHPIIDMLSATIRGKYYAGGPVKHGKVRWKVSYSNTSFNQSGYPDYTFGSTAGAPEGIIESGETTLDEKGAATVSLPISKEVAAGIYSVELTASVVDFDGKVSTSTESYSEEPSYMAGISPHSSAIQAGDAQELRLVVLNNKGQKVQMGSLTAEIMRREYNYVMKRNDDGHAYWERSEVYVKELIMPLRLTNGNAAFSFDFTRDGDYLIKFVYKTKEGRQYASSTKLSVGSAGYHSSDSNEIKFERLSITTDKATYSIGETIRVHVGSRRNLNSLLMTIEREGVLEHSVINLKSGKKYIDIPVRENYGPNVYISFVGLTGRGDFPLHSNTFDSAAPSFLFGTAKVQIRQKADTLKISINAGESQLVAEPGAKVTLRLSATDADNKGVETEMAVAVVDESVLAMTGFQTPSLAALGQFIVPLGVLTGEARAELLRQTPYAFIKNRRLTGGDGSEDGDDADGKLRKDFRPVAFFDPAVRTGIEGHAQVTFTLPDSMTAYRVYVVACDRKDRFASTQRNLLAKRDFYVEPGTPRFFTKGDRFTFFVSAFNKTAQSGSVIFSPSGDGKIQLSAEKSMVVPAQDRQLIPVTGEALSAGLSTLQFRAALRDNKDRVEVKLPVKSGYLVWNDVQYGTLRGKSIVNYMFPKDVNHSWKDMPASELRAVLTVSASPFFRLSQGFRYLLEYPYGCVEQTSSKVMPLAALRSLVSNGFLPEMSLGDTDKYLKQGVERLLSMQTAKGGFGYWPGQREPHPWGSIYATNALTQAKLAGFGVPDARLDQALKYLTETVRSSEYKAKTYHGFVLYLLAVNGKLTNDLFKEVYPLIDTLPRQGALLSLLAAHLSKQLPESVIIEKTRIVLNKPQASEPDEFYATHREAAVALMTSAAILKHSDPATGKLAANLLDSVGREGRWGSTSDTGWALIALGEYFKGKFFSVSPLDISIEQPGGQIIKKSLPKGGSVALQLDAKLLLKSPGVTVQAPANRDLAYSLALSYPRMDWAKKGLSQGFSVAKRIENLDGGQTIRVGDIVKVTVTLQSKGGYHYRHVVLDDPLPAGFVAINSALKTEEKVKKKRSDAHNESEESDADADTDDDGDSRNEPVETSSDDTFDTYGYASPFYPNHFELRDDRVLAFRNNLYSGAYEYSYYARAVCQGEFVLPQTKVQLMYQPEIVGFTPMTTISIKPRK